MRTSVPKEETLRADTLWIIYMGNSPPGFSGGTASTCYAATLAPGKPIALDTILSCPREHGSFKIFRDSRGKQWSFELWSSRWDVVTSIPGINVSLNTEINIWNRILVRLKLSFAPKYCLSLSPWRGALGQPRVMGNRYQKGELREKQQQRFLNIFSWLYKQYKEVLEVKKGIKKKIKIPSTHNILMYFL